MLDALGQRIGGDGDAAVSELRHRARARFVARGEIDCVGVGTTQSKKALRERPVMKPLQDAAEPIPLRLERPAQGVVLTSQPPSQARADQNSVPEIQAIELPPDKREIVVAELARQHREEVREALRAEICRMPVGQRPDLPEHVDEDLHAGDGILQKTRGKFPKAAPHLLQPLKRFIRQAVELADDLRIAQAILEHGLPVADRRDVIGRRRHERRLRHVEDELVLSRQGRHQNVEFEVAGKVVRVRGWSAVEFEVAIPMQKKGFHRLKPFRDLLVGEAILFRH